MKFLAFLSLVIMAGILAISLFASAHLLWGYMS